MTRILVVDDDAAVRSVVTEALLEDGYQVDAAGNGRQALAAFREHRPDALVLDLEMPIMNGHCESGPSGGECLWLWCPALMAQQTRPHGWALGHACTSHSN